MDGAWRRMRIKGGRREGRRGERKGREKERGYITPSAGTYHQINGLEDTHELLPASEVCLCYLEETEREFVVSPLRATENI
jgi:hypothetical protein